MRTANGRHTAFALVCTKQLTPWCQRKLCVRKAPFSKGMGRLSYLEVRLDEGSAANLDNVPALGNAWRSRCPDAVRWARCAALNVWWSDASCGVKKQRCVGPSTIDQDQSMQRNSPSHSRHRCVASSFTALLHCSPSCSAASATLGSVGWLASTGNACARVARQTLSPR